MLLKNKKNYSQEAIGFQLNDWFVKDCQQATQQFLENKINSTQYSKILTQITNKRFNLKVNYLIDDSFNGSVMPVRFDTNHILHGEGGDTVEAYADVFSKWNHAIMVKVAKGELSSTGWLDYKRAKVSGLFAQVETEIMIGSKFLTYINDPLQITAVIVHELGHIWTYFEYLGVASFRNCILIGTVKEVLETNTDAELKKIIIDTKNVWGIEVDENLNEKIKDKQQIGNIIVGSIQKKFSNDPAYALHNLTNAEAVADQFLSRFGLGEAQVKLLERIDKPTWAYYRNNANRLALIYIISAVSIISSNLFLLFAPAGMVMGFPFAVLYGLLGVNFTSGFLMALTQYSVRFNAYDNTKDRMQRVYNDTLNLIKNPNLDKRVLDSIMRELHEMKQVIDKTPNYSDNIAHRFMRWINSEYRTQDEIKSYQQLVESLMANQLYVSAAKFKQMK